MMNLKKMIALIMSCMLALGCFCAYAEDTVDVILNAGTTQSFSDQAVSEDDLKLILQAGLSAASAINQQPWYFAAITNKEVMAEISAGSGFGGAPAGMPEGGFPAGGMPGGMPGGAASGSMPAMPQGGMRAAGGSAKAALGDSPVAIVIYMNENTSFPNASFDCGLACQNMVIAANALGYGNKIISSPTMSLNGANHDALCEKLGVNPSYTAVAVLLIGIPDTEVDAVTSASLRNDISGMVSFVD